jgi:predicted mannosyl-3-phosphoglycerate phosphatase (HAD superfamily)
MGRIPMAGEPWEWLRMEKGGVVQLVKRILKSDTDFNFLLKLEARELETLVAYIRVRLELENSLFTA